MFDLVTPAVVAADHVVANVLDASRAARLVQQHAVDPSLPNLLEVIDELIEATFGARPANPYEAEIKRAVERVVTGRLMRLADAASMPQVRAEALLRLKEQSDALERMAASADEPNRAHYGLLVHDIGRFLSGDAPVSDLVTVPAAPPGAPIGEPAMDWLGLPEPWCMQEGVW
jgi:hypothetical protein